MPNHHPCLADLLPAGSEVGEVGEVAALLLAVPTGDLRLHLNRPHPVLLGDADRSILSQHSTTEPGVPSHPHRQYLFLFIFCKPSQNQLLFLWFLGPDSHVKIH